MSAPAQDHDYRAAVTGWAAALGTADATPWRAWCALGRTAASVDPHGPLPSAPQLELVRRLAATDPALPAFDRLAALVLGTPPVGRGPVDVPLAWPGAGHSWGTPAVDPEQLGAGQLLRVAVPVLDRLLPPATAGSRPARPGPRRRLGRRFAVHGTPLGAAAVREALVRAGWIEGEFRAVHLVIATPLPQAVAEHWSDRVAHGAGRTWRRTCARLAMAGLPVRLDPDAAVRRLRATVPPRVLGDRVQVLVAADPAAAVREAHRLLALRDAGGPPPGEDPTATGPGFARTDLRRRLNLLRPGAGSALVAGQPLASDLDDPAPAVPPAQRPWAAATGTHLAERLREADYPVHGDPDLLAHDVGDRTASGPDRTLRLALDTIVATWRAREGEH